MIYIVVYSKKCLDFLKMFLMLYTDNSSDTLFTHLQHLLNLEHFFFLFLFNFYSIAIILLFIS